MVAKIFKTGVEARKAILEGFRKVHDNVAISLGPKGRLAVIQEGTLNKITKDGYTIARSIGLEDPFEDQGATLAKQTADLANTEVGDGTTTSTIVGYAAAYEAAKMVDAGHNPQELKRGMEYAMKQAVEFIQSIAQPVETDDAVRKIAMVSSNFDENIANISRNDEFCCVQYLDTGSITQNYIDALQLLDCRHDELPSRAKRKVFDGDIVYSTVRPNLRHYGLIYNPPKNLIASTGFAVLHKTKH